MFVQVSAGDPALDREQAALTGGSLYSFNLGEDILIEAGMEARVMETPPGDGGVDLYNCTRYDRVEVDMFTPAKSTYCPLCCICMHFS